MVEPGFPTVQLSTWASGELFTDSRQAAGEADTAPQLHPSCRAARGGPPSRVVRRSVGVTNPGASPCRASSAHAFAKALRCLSPDVATEAGGAAAAARLCGGSVHIGLASANATVPGEPDGVASNSTASSPLLIWPSSSVSMRGRLQGAIVAPRAMSCGQRHSGCGPSRTT